MDEKLDHQDGQDEARLDEAFARLQAADPAAGAEPDLAALRSSLTGATGVVLPAATQRPDELAARRRRRGTRWAQVAAVAVGALVVGSAGYGLGAGALTANESAGSSADLAVAPERAAGDSAVAGSSGAGTSSGSESAQSLADSKMSSYWYGGRTVFSAQGLSDAGGSAHAWAMDAASVVSADTASRLASALGLSGDPQQQWGSWVVGSTDGSGPSLSLSGDGQASVSFYDPSRDPWTCQEGQTPDSSGMCGSSGDAVAGDAAIEQARMLLTSLGVDLTDWQLAVQDTGTSLQTTVVATHVLDGVSTGLTWNLTYVGSGLQSLWGTVAPLVDLGAYDVVSPAQAVARLNDPRFGATGGGVMPLMEGRADGTVSSAEGSEPMVDGDTTVDDGTVTVPATVQPGSSIGWPVSKVTIVSAQLGVAVTTLPSGAVVLAPTYTLSDATGATWSVIAVADSGLDLTSAAG